MPQIEATPTPTEATPTPTTPRKKGPQETQELKNDAKENAVATSINIIYLQTNDPTQPVRTLGAISKTVLAHIKGKTTSEVLQSNNEKFSSPPKKTKTDDKKSPKISITPPEGQKNKQIGLGLNLDEVADLDAGAEWTFMAPVLASFHPNP